VQHFKCNLSTIRGDYPHINTWLSNLYFNVPGFKETTNFRHIKENYTKSHYDINPKGITPMGPFPDVESVDERVMDAWRRGTLRVGECKHPRVLRYEREELEREG
jgi:glutathionyl-hydroquinone reductase